MDAVELAPRDRQVARLLGAAGEHHRVELGEHLFRRHDSRAQSITPAPGRCVADAHCGPERHALRLHLLACAGRSATFPS